MTNQKLVQELGRILATGFWQWDMRGVSHLPPGAWLRRTHATGTPLDMFQPEFIHPLLALATYRGRFAADSLRSEFTRVAEAQATFEAALQYWSEALDITRGEAAKWFYVFTPPLCPIPREMIWVADLLDRRREDVWAKLGLQPTQLSALLLAASPPYHPNAVRSEFWSREVRLR